MAQPQVIDFGPNEGSLTTVTNINFAPGEGSTVLVQSGLPHWEAAGSPWDKLKLGNIVMPGLWEVTSGECARQVDHKKTKGKDGATIRDQGVLPARFSARCRMVSVADWQALQKVMPSINPKKHGVQRSPLAIYHPAIAIMGIHTIYVERVRVPEVKDGVMELTIDMIEWEAEPKPTKPPVPPKRAPSVLEDGPDTYIQRTRDFHLQPNRGWNQAGFSGAAPPPAQYVNGARISNAGLAARAKTQADDDALLKNIDRDKAANTPRAPSDGAGEIDPSELRTNREDYFGQFQP